MSLAIKYIIGIGLLILIVASMWLLFTGQNTSKPETNESVNTELSIPPVTSESPPFVGTVWRANTIVNNSILEGTAITVQFNDQGKLTGFDGCNTLSTGYTMNDSSLAINQAMASTNKACEEGVMTQADSFTQALLATTGYKLGDGILVLSQNGVDGLSFFGQSNSLSKTSWSVTGYNNGNQAVVSPILETSLSVTFGDDGTISGSSGCNTFSGQYSLNGQSITISPLATTLMACIEPEGISEQETAFLSALESAVLWQMQGDQLSLRTENDELAITALNNLVAIEQ